MANIFGAMGQNGNASMQGASQGMQSGSPWGALIGGIAGGANDIFNQVGSFVSARQQAKQLDNYQKQLKSQYEKGQLTLQEYESKMNEANAQYNKELAEADWENASKIDFDKSKYNVDDYRDSNEKEQLETTANTMNAQNIGNGSSWGTGAQANLIKGVMKTQGDLDDKAYARMDKDMDFDYGIAKDNADSRVTALKNKLASTAQIAQNNKDVINATTSGEMNLQNVYNQGTNDVTKTRIQNGLASDGSWSSAFKNFFGF